MKRLSLRAAYVGATLSTLLALASAEPAHAHVSIQPQLLERGTLTELRIELPRLRPGAPPRRLEVEGAGIEVRSSRLVTRVGVETAWSVRLRATAEPGVVPVVLRAVYADGRSVEVDERLTVVPGAESSGFPWVGVLAAVLLAAAFAAVSLALARRKA